MKKEITRDLLRSTQPGKAAIDIADTKLPGFYARIMPSGAIHFSIRYTDGHGKQVRYSLKRSFPSTNVSDARELARIELGRMAAGESPAQKRKDAFSERLSLFAFIEGHYADYLRSRNKDHAATLFRLKKCFGQFKDIPLAKIDTLRVEQWRNTRIAAGISPVTVNRDIGALRPVFSRAVEWGLIDQQPLKSVKQLKSTGDPIVRFLNDEEEARLRKALDQRETNIRAARIRANEWRSARRCELYPEISETVFINYLKPAVLLSLNTGIRQGELLQLRWNEVDLERHMLTVRGASAKSGKARHVPLNDEAWAVLDQWRKQQGASLLVFPGRNNNPIVEVKTAWRKLLQDAGISNFRWHDMRHHFASRLVMAGVDLNTVRELLGHADLKMTLRYAHLAPEHKAAAVQKLMRKLPTTTQPKKAA